MSAKKKKVRTKPESEELREKAYDFLRYRCLGSTGKSWLKEQGYSSAKKKAFIAKHGVGHDYFVQLKKRKDFKEEFFGHLTLEYAQDLALYFDVLLKKDPLKLIQLIFPIQTGKALVTHNVNHETTDDSEFIHKFFGIDKK